MCSRVSECARACGGIRGFNDASHAPLPARHTNNVWMEQRGQNKKNPEYSPAVWCVRSQWAFLSFSSPFWVICPSLSLSHTLSLFLSRSPWRFFHQGSSEREREREAPSSESTCWAEERSGHASALLLCARTHTSERKRERFTLLWSGWVTVKNSLNSNWDKYEYKYSLLEIWWRLSDTYVCYIISIKLSNCCKMSSYSFSGDEKE